MPAHDPHSRPSRRWHGHPAHGSSRHGRDVRATRRRYRPACEGLETRDPPASHPLGPALPGKHYPAPDVQQFVPLLYPPGTSQPTPAEIQRESFVVKGVGRYTIGPGHFDTQTIAIHGYGKPATSNLSRKIHFQYEIFEPRNPTRAVTGVM